MNDTNPLRHTIENLEELVKSTSEEVDETNRKLQEAEETGNLEAFLKEHQKSPK